jgi:xylan 1,4-beta-xylosidase
MIQNPILPGFNPDPSICRVGEDVYIATSTFEWYPGVQIHHSRDLVNWRLVSRPLNRPEQLDMRGNPDSGGIWAPCLSYADGKFWLVYTDVKRLDGAFKDAHNYIVTCETIDGDWSDPIYVNSSGFDPSLFHDSDGRKWFMNMQWNHRQEGSGRNPSHNRFDGILLQEWSLTEGLIGPVNNIYPGTKCGLTEAPHIFTRDGWYYLTTAEGGTGYRHAVTLARSREIWGPYENHPDLHVISTADAPAHPIQRTGHGQIVEMPDGSTYHTFLMGRPIAGPDGKGRFCPLGRETGIEKCMWGEDGWPRLEHGGLLPRTDVPGPDHSVLTEPATPVVHEPFGDKLPDEFQWLRTPHPERIFELKNSALVLKGRESIGSWFEQSLVARRQEHHAYTAETRLDFEPETYQQAAGLTTYYNRTKFHAAMVSWDPEVGRSLSIMSCSGDYPEGALTFPLDAPIQLAEGSVRLKVSVKHARQQFFWAQDGSDWQALGPALDASLVSDEGGRGEHASFTGAFVGMVAFDITGQGKEAAFTHFGYSPESL